MAVPNHEGASAVESLGARLKQERERQKITLDDVATSTKIGTRMLKALEDDHYDQLPGGIFNKGFVRAYARHLGMDEEQAVADYLAATSPVQPTKEPEAVLSALAVRAQEARTTEPGSGDLPWDKLAAVLLLVAFGFALWGWRTRKELRALNNQQTSPPATVSAPVVATPPNVEGQPPATGEVQSPGPATATPVSSAPAPAVTPPPDSTPAQVPSTSPAAAGSFVLQIHAHDDSWIEVSADGKNVSHELLSAGAQKSFQAQREILVKVGNVGGLDFTFNDRKLPAQGTPDEVKTLRFDASGLLPK